MKLAHLHVVISINRYNIHLLDETSITQCLLKGTAGPVIAQLEIDTAYPNISVYLFYV